MRRKSIKINGDRPHIKRLVIAIFFALLLVIGLLFWQMSSWNFIMEESFQKATIWIGKRFNSESIPVKRDSVFLIDVSGSLEFISQKDSDDIVVANRETLTQLFIGLNQKGINKKIIICDLFFDKKSPYDQELEKVFTNFPNLLSPQTRNKNGHLIPNVVKVGESAPAGYEVLAEPFFVFSNSLLKFKLSDDKNKTLPLLIYERADTTKVLPGNFFLKIGDSFFLNSVPVIQHLTYSDNEINKGRPSGPLFAITSLVKDLKDTSSYATSTIKKAKFIIIGNFKEDVHKTLEGDVKGPLALFNLFLSIEMRENKISLIYIFLLLFVFTIIIYDEFFHFKIFVKIDRYSEGFVKKIGLSEPLKFTFLFVYIFGLISSIFFHIQFEVIAGFVFLKVIKWVRVYILTRRFKLRNNKNHKYFEFSLKNVILFLFEKPGFKKE